MSWILESPRLCFRRLSRQDMGHLQTILQDAEIMYAWEHAFTEEEVSAWLEKNLARYEGDGYGFFATIERQTGYFVGVMGPLQDELDGAPAIEIAYILDKRYWGRGYALEGARACMDYAFIQLNAPRVIAEIRPNNLPSRRVAEGLGMEIVGELTKHYYHKDMPHLIYSRVL